MIYVTSKFYVYLLGQRVQRDKRSPYVKELEEGDTETVLANKRWQKEIKHHRELKRFSDGPVFKQLNQPKRSFFHRHANRFLGFFGCGCVFFYFIYPMYGLFVQPFMQPSLGSQNNLGNEDPADVLEKVICNEYLREHGMPYFSRPEDKKNEMEH